MHFIADMIEGFETSIIIGSRSPIDLRKEHGKKNFSSYDIVMDTVSIRRRLNARCILLLRFHLHEFTTPLSTPPW